MEFNLVDKKWIPCLMLKDNRAEELSLRETLIDAHKISEVFDNSPLVTVSLHRLLLAILHRNFGPASFGKWQELWKEKQWHAEKLNQYLNEQKYRFNLFDDERPFYQTVKVFKNEKEELADKQPIGLLAQELATGNNATLFDHNFESSNQSLEAKSVAKYLIARQAFSLVLGVSYPFGLQDSTMIRGFTVLANGENLFETLALNLITYNDNKPFVKNEDDLPIWEQDNPAQPEKEGTTPNGYLDYLTWQPRQIRLIPRENSTNVEKCRLQQNLKLAGEPKIYDPFKCYVRKDIKESYRAKGLSPEKSLWRDSNILFEQFSGQSSNSLRPQVFDHLNKVEKARMNGEIEAKSVYAFSTFGIVTDFGKASSVILWSRERLPLPMIYLTDEGKDLVNELKDALKLADDFSSILRESMRSMAKFLLAPDPKMRQPDGEDVGRLVKTFGADGIYWSRLSQSFNKLLIDLPKDFQEMVIDKDAARRNKALSNWAETLNKTVKIAFDSVINSLSGSARELKAIASAEKEFYGKLRILKKENPHLFDTKNKTEVK